MVIFNRRFTPWTLIFTTLRSALRSEAVAMIKRKLLEKLKEAC